ncbi:Origin recognition complex subunit 6 [Holothuria leucospilota]|uniref:Origin recognition complex subunit 6 n=1 Tax=Holothuria leucospilota TaxID=206669 RepID=A0A9Q1HCR6_HOLLE|nr:Origin recognition complex subunit 6 [Holothuria leucospilota]
MSQLQQFKKIADRLGVDSPAVSRKALELDRLCEVRCSGSGLASLSFSGSSRTVLCVELAATSVGEKIDRKFAVKLSGLTAVNYTSSLKTLQRLLQLDSTYSLRDLAVKFGCTEAVSKAQELLARYQKEFESTASDDTKDDVELGRPLFSCAALYTICRQMKIKVDKAKMVEVAGVKRNTFDRLVAALQKLETTEVKSSGSNRQTNWIDNLDELADKEDIAKKRKRKSLEKNRKGEKEEEDYEEWKKRILAATESCDT